MQLTTQQKNSVPFQYANDVLSGNIITGKRVRQAVERFFRWIETAESDGYYINHAKGMHVIDFFETFLIHTLGKKTGKPFKLSPYQQFTLYNIFGWVKMIENEEVRRIKNVYEKIAKKNGKTAVMAGLSLYIMAFDDESQANVYVGATKEEQAKICFDQAVEFIKKSPLLNQIGFRIFQKHIEFIPLSSKMRPLGGDSKTQDGINPHLSVIDEYHAHKDDSVKENLESAMAARKQPLLYTITTAGVYISGVCKIYEEMCKDILDGTKEDDTFFIMIHDIDENDNWMSVKNWKKANPNINQSVYLDFLKSEFKKTVNQPSKAPNFKTKHLNMWVDAPQIWIPDEIWSKGNEPIKIENFTKFGCTAAVDLSTNTDITAIIVLSEPDEQDIRDIYPLFFCPKTTIDVRSREDHVPYRYWVDAGYLIATDGNSIDYNIIENKILNTYAQFQPKTIEFDPYNATQITQSLQDKGLPVSKFSQTIMNFSFPTKMFEKLALDGKLRHGNNPILRWMLAGAVVIKDTNENIRVVKNKNQRQSRRVDGIIATIMALGGSYSTQNENTQSAYNNPENKFVCF